MSDHLLTPPTNREAEQSVLGALLADREALGEALARLQPEDFFTEDNRAVYRAILALHERGALRAAAGQGHEPRRGVFLGA